MLATANKRQTKSHNAAVKGLAGNYIIRYSVMDFDGRVSDIDVAYHPASLSDVFRQETGEDNFTSLRNLISDGMLKLPHAYGLRVRVYKVIGHKNGIPLLRNAGWRYVDKYRIDGRFIYANDIPESLRPRLRMFEDDNI